MGRLGFLFQLQLTFSKPVNHHAFQLRCLPKSSARQEVVQSSFCVLPECETMMSEDYFGMKQSGFSEINAASTKNNFFMVYCLYYLTIFFKTTSDSSYFSEA